MSPASSPSSAFSYDAASRLQTVTSGTNTATYDYLPNSNLVQTLTYTQGAATRLTTTKVYDNLNRLQSIVSTPSAASAVEAAYVYNNANQRTRLTREDNAYWNFSYDALGQVVTGQKRLPDHNGLAGYDYSYAYDDIGNRKTATTNGQVSTYTPTLLNQYSQRTIPASLDVLGTAATDATVAVISPAVDGTIYPTTRQGETFFTQLPVNNASTAQYPSLKISAVKNNVGTNGEDAVTEITKSTFVAQTPEAFTHDADGNLTADGRWTYAWDAENRLVSCETTVAAVSAGVPKQRLEFAYDYAGRRIQKVVKAWNTTTSNYQVSSDTRFLYDGWNLVAEFNALASNAVVRTYVWGTDLSGSMQGAGGVGGLLAVNSGSATYFPTYDGGGNITGLVNAADGTLSAEFEYDPFGNVIKAVGAAANVQPFGFSTKYTDTETGLCYYGYRFYQPSTGRWPNRDPIEEEGGVNLYGMVGNDTVSHWDMLGMKRVTVDFNNNYTYVDTHVYFLANGMHIVQEKYYIYRTREAYVDYECKCENGKQIVYPTGYGWVDGGKTDIGGKSPQFFGFSVEFSDTLSATLPVSGGSPIVVELSWDSVGKIGKTAKYRFLGFPLKLTLGEYHEKKRVTLTCP